MQRPGVRNAFNAALIEEVRAAFDTLAREDTVRAVVIAGDGKMFSGGADIAWMRAALDLDQAANLRDAGTMAAMFRTIDSFPKPVIARVQGGALGGGCGLIAAADIAVAADDAIFGFTEVKLGIIPAVISPYVVAKIGRSHARALFVTGERFTAPRALAIGLVHDIVAADALDERIDAILAELATSGPEAIAAVKTLVAHVAGAPASEVDSYTTRAIADRRVSLEGQEGLRAFVERRVADWHAS
jgi:methylglutaconyl-CoA hydratase